MPWVNWGLIVLNILIYVLTSVSPDGSHGPLALYHGQPVRDVLALDPQNPALWQYFTYQFLHENWLHVLGNMLFLYIFGNNINDRMGHLGYIGFYLAGGVMAGVGYVAFDRLRSSAPAGPLPPSRAPTSCFCPDPTSPSFFSGCIRSRFPVSGSFCSISCRTSSAKNWAGQNPSPTWPTSPEPSLGWC